MSLGGIAETSAAIVAVRLARHHGGAAAAAVHHGQVAGLHRPVAAIGIDQPAAGRGDADIDDAILGRRRHQPDRGRVDPREVNVGERLRGQRDARRCFVGKVHAALDTDAERGVDRVLAQCGRHGITRETQAHGDPSGRQMPVRNARRIEWLALLGRTMKCRISFVVRADHRKPVAEPHSIFRYDDAIEMRVLQIVVP
jgi:hypothetical protein